MLKVVSVTSPKCVFGAAILAAGLLGLSIASARATILYQTDGSDISGYVGRDVARPDGGTVETAVPFTISGVSQGPYFAATEYPLINFTSISAADPGTQEIWLTFLMGRDNRNAWAGGILLADGTAPATPGIPALDVAALAGWHTSANAISLRDGNENVVGGQTAQPFNTAGSTIAVLARIYENGTSGVFDRGEIYYDINLADGIGFNVTGGTNLNLSSGANATINLLRLNADGNSETRYYDNIGVATTQAEALSIVPEPSVALLGGFGLLGLLSRRRRTC